MEKGMTLSEEVQTIFLHRPGTCQAIVWRTRVEQRGNVQLSRGQSVCNAHPRIIPGRKDGVGDH